MMGRLLGGGLFAFVRLRNLDHPGDLADQFYLPMAVRLIADQDGASEHAFYRWKSKFGGARISDAKRLKAMEDETRRLRTLVADLTLDDQSDQRLSVVR